MENVQCVQTVFQMMLSKKEKNKKNVFIHFTKRDKNYIRYKVLDGQCCQVAFDISVS